MFKVLDKVCTPQRGTKHSAYVDLFAREDVEMWAGETNIVPLGVKIDPNFFIYEIAGVNIDTDGTVKDGNSNKVEEFLKSHYLEVALRSSLAVKGLIIPNGIGIVDLDYSGEISLILHKPMNIGTVYSLQQDNDPSCTKIKRGDKVCQCTLKEHKGYLMGYDSDVVRDGGFGSTGEKA